MTRSFPHRALVGALLLLAPALAAQQAPLTLQQAVAMAQRQGLAAVAARQTLAAAEARDRAYGDRLLPQVALSGSVPNYSSQIVPVVQPDGSQLFTPLQQTTSLLGLTVSQKLGLTGGNLSVTSSLQQFRLAGAQDVHTWSSVPFTVSLNQPLFRPNTAKWDTRAQDLTTEIARRQYSEAMEGVALQTASAFFDLYSAQVQRQNATRNVAVNDTLYTLNKGRFQVGKIAENDLLQSELALLRARTSLGQAQLDYGRTLAAFRLAIGVPEGTDVAIAATPDIPKIRLDTARAVQEALRNASAIQTLALQSVQAQRSVSEARFGGGPGATLQASLGFNASGAAVGDAYRDLLQARQVSLGLQVPLFQWGAHSADVQAARANQQSVAAQAAVKREQTVQAARFAALQVEQAAANLDVSAKADTVANKRYTVAYERYVIGKINVDALYLAQNDKDSALLAYVQALRGYWAAYYQLRQATLYDFVNDRPIPR